MKSPAVLACPATFLLVAAGLLAAESPVYRSHPPVRPLPEPSLRPLTPGPARFVDSRKGNDAHDGSQDKPWKTAAYAVRQLGAGDTLYLRGGTYYEQVVVKQSGRPE